MLALLVTFVTQANKSYSWKYIFGAVYGIAVAFKSASNIAVYRMLPRPMCSGCLVLLSESVILESLRIH